MQKYIAKRLAYSLLVIFGVMLISFLLFKFSAGDPSSMLLGKNPSASEIEELRDKLSVGKPFLYGKWKRTETYSSADFGSDKELPSVQLPPGAPRDKGYLILPKGAEIIFKRNFESSDQKILSKISFDGRIFIGTDELTPDFSGSAEFVFENCGDKDFRIIAANDSKISSVKFFKPNPHPFDSQFLSSIKEIISFSEKLPYVSFFNFGKTLTTRENIDSVIWRSMWVSLSLMLPIFFMDTMFSIPLAMIAAVFRGRLTDKAITVISVSGMSISYIVLIVLGQWILSYRLGLFPVWGFESAYYLALPVILGTVSGLGGSVRFYRTIFLNELRKEYLRTALSKGCSPLRIYFKHLLKNASVPIVARISTTLPFLFTGSLLLESFFGIPGLGFEAINALNNSDLQMLKALVLLTSILFVIMNLLADLVNSYFDPRIQLE